MADTTVRFEFERYSPEVAPVIVREDESAMILDLCSGVESAYEALIQRFEQPVFNIVRPADGRPRPMPPTWHRKFF